MGKVLAASVARLEERLQTLWRDLSVYNQVFGLEAAQAMQSGATLEDLWELANRSMVQELPQQRFEFLPLVQRFAQQQAGEQTAAHEKAAAYWL